MPSSEEILRSLNVIKVVCQCHESCINCPLRDITCNAFSLKCGLERAPRAWELVTSNNWSAFSGQVK